MISFCLQILIFLSLSYIMINIEYNYSSQLTLTYLLYNKNLVVKTLV